MDDITISKKNSNTNNLNESKTKLENVTNNSITNTKFEHDRLTDYMKLNYYLEQNKIIHKVAEKKILTKEIFEINNDEEDDILMDKINSLNKKELKPCNLIYLNNNIFPLKQQHKKKKIKKKFDFNFEKIKLNENRFMNKGD